MTTNREIIKQAEKDLREQFEIIDENTPDNSELGVGTVPKSKKFNV